MSSAPLHRAVAAHATLARGCFVAASAIAFVVSAVLFFSGDRESGIFVGLWVPSILALGALLVPRRAEH